MGRKLLVEDGWEQRAMQRLVAGGLVSEKDLQRGVELAAASEVSLGEALTQLGVATPEQTASVIADEFEIPFLTPYPATVERELLDLFVAQDLRRFDAVPVLREGDDVVVAFAEAPNPEHVQVLQEQARTHAGFRNASVLPAVAPRQKIRHVLQRLLPGARWGPTPGASLHADDPALRPLDPGAIRLLYNALTRAIVAGATELRFDPQKDVIRVTHRIDGLLQGVGDADLKLHGALLARARILAGAPAGSRGPLDPTVLQSIVAEVPVRLEVTVFEGDPRGSSVRVTITRAHVPQRLHDFALSDDATRLLAPADEERGLLLVCSSHLEVAAGLAFAAGVEARPLERYVMTLGALPLEPIDDFRRADELRQVIAARPDVLLTTIPRIDTAADLAECAGRMRILVVTPESDPAAAVRRWLDTGVRRSVLARVLSGVVYADPEAPFAVRGASLDEAGRVALEDGRFSEVATHLRALR